MDIVKIAICMGLNDHYEHGIVRGVVRYAKEHPTWELYGYGWMFRPLADLPHWEGDGIITRVESDDEAQLLSTLHLPVVDVAGAYVWSGFMQVTNDDYLTGERAAAYLASCGFTRYAYCGVSQVGWSRKRLEGFSHGLDEGATELPVFEDSLDWWEQLENYEHLGEWLGSLEYPVGIFACNDTAGVKITEECRERGIRVPDDVAVLGVDNEDILCELSRPSLSSIDLNCEAIGYEAARLLDKQIRGMADRDMHDILRIPPGRVIARGTTDIFTNEDRIVREAVQFVRRNAAEGIKVADVIRQVPASRRSLEIRFKEAMGLTIHEEIMRVRIEHAKRLLRTTDYTVSRVATESGFGTVQRFYSIFREAVGHSPSHYRKLQLHTLPGML